LQPPNPAFLTEKDFLSVWFRENPFNKLTRVGDVSAVIMGKFHLGTVRPGPSLEVAMLENWEEKMDEWD
jgi:hypothetical protein